MLTVKMGSVRSCSSALQRLNLSTPVGPVKVTGCTLGIHEINLAPSDKAPCGKLETVTIIGEERKTELSKPLQECLDWLEEFFKKENSINTMSLPPLHTSTKPDTFIGKVLDTLAHKVPAGETVSYKELAVMAGNPKASRAVGTAMRMNKVPLVIPCHRVIKSDGSLGNYMSGKGVALKSWLLEHEGAKVNTK